MIHKNVSDILLLKKLQSIQSEISIVLKSDIDKARRFDSEYFRPDYLEVEEHLEKIETQIVEDIFFKVKNGVDYRDYSQKGNTYYIRTADIQKGGFQNTSIKINYPNIPLKIKLKMGDILFTRKGNYGKNCIVDEVLSNSLISSEIMLLRKKKNQFRISYLSMFFNSKYGTEQVERNVHGVSNFSITQEAINKIKIPIFRDDFQLKIESAVKMAHTKQKQSRQTYKKAEEILLQQLDLLDYESNNALTYTTTKKEMDKARRFDAEYFQPKYDEIVATIKSYSGGWDTLDNLVLIRKSIEVGSDEYKSQGIPFVRVSNLSSFEITEEKYISMDLYQALCGFQPSKGDILLTKDATPGIAHYLSEAPQKMLPSGGILCLTKKLDKINGEYLTLVLNSVLTQEQVKRDVGGSVILHWRPDQIKETLIPILPKSKQLKIQKMVVESFNLRKQSKYLLECAKQAVEMAIEKDEKTAINWLEMQQL